MSHTRSYSSAHVRSPSRSPRASPNKLHARGNSVTTPSQPHAGRTPAARRQRRATLPTASPVRMQAGPSDNHRTGDRLAPVPPSMPRSSGPSNAFTHLSSSNPPTPRSHLPADTLVDLLPPTAKRLTRNVGIVGTTATLIHSALRRDHDRNFNASCFDSVQHMTLISMH